MGNWEEIRGWKRYFYPLSYRLHCMIRDRLGIPYPEEKIRKCAMLRPDTAIEDLRVEYDCERICYILMIFLVSCLLAVVSVLTGGRGGLLRHSYYLERGEPGEGTREIRITARAGSMEQEVSLDIPERRYTAEELEEKFQEARKYVLENYLGENESAENVTEDLCFVSKIPDSQIAVEWRPDSNRYVNQDGTLNNEELDESIEVVLTVKFSYGEKEESMSLPCIICPEKRTAVQIFWREWQDQLRRLAEETEQKADLVLPRKIGEQELSYKEKRIAVWPKMILLGIFICVCIPGLFDSRTEQGMKKRGEQMQREYPEVVERFILLIGAGLTIRGAWYRITEDYCGRLGRGEISMNYLYEEMLVTRREMENGRSEASAYAAFGDRVSLLSYMKFSSLLAQNLKKGSDDLLRRMEQEAVDAVKERKEYAKKQGEEAGTKLLFPMMLMLIVVFAIIMTAAFGQI